MVFMQTQQPKIEHGRRSGALLLSPGAPRVLGRHEEKEIVMT
jgi:hypothetical protein